MRLFDTLLQISDFYYKYLYHYEMKRISNFDFQILARLTQVHSL
jgi:hypothetical protein